MKKVAVVIGSTGLVGSHLIKLLLANDDFSKIVSVTRRPVSYTSSKVINEVIDFEDIDLYSNIFKGDVLFSALGTTLKSAGSIEKQRTVDFNYQLKIAKLAQKNNIAHLVLVSSSGASSKSSSSYLKMKGELEDAVVLLGFKRVSILQPSLLLGQRSEYRLSESLGALIIPMFCKLPGLSKYRPIQGEEVARFMMKLSKIDKKGVEVFKLDELFI